MGNGNTSIYSEKSSYASLQSSNTDYEQSTEAINLKPTLGTAAELEIFGEVANPHKFYHLRRQIKKTKGVKLSIFC